MTLPKGYVPPNKKAEDEKAKQLADEKAKQLADEKAKQLADEKAIAKVSNSTSIPTESSDRKYESQAVNNDIDYNTSYPIDYAKIWDEMKKAYLQTVKEATTSYLRLMDFWIKDLKK
jgi:hypothetical protein